MNKVDLVERSRLRTDIPSFGPGDTVKVHVRVTEGNRERIQVFQGVVISRRGGGLRESFTVRKVSFGVGVERTFPVHAPMMSKLEIVTHGKVRRAKLYYLRELTGRKAKIRERRVAVPEEGAAAEVTQDIVEVAAPEEPEATAEATAEGAPEASTEAEAEPPAEAETAEEPTEKPAET